MMMIFSRAAAAGFVTVAILCIATSSNGEPAAIATGATVVSEGKRIAEVDMRIKTDNYLVPAHVCPDADAEKYEDCVPRSQVGENAIFALPAAE